MEQQLQRLPYTQLKANRATWYAIIASIIIELLLIKYWHLKIDAPGLPLAIIIMSVCLLIALFYRYIKRDDGLSLFANAFNQLVCGSFAIATGTYLGAYLGRPLTDPTLVKIDAFFGFDWRDYIVWVDTKPILATLMEWAYNSAGIQFLILLPMLFYNRSAHAQRTFITLYTAGMLTVIFSALWPAMAGYIYYNVDVASLHNTPSAARIHEQLSLGLQHRTITTLPYPGIGIVTFPSFHTAVAAGLIYAARAYKPTTYILIPLNIMMILSTPYVGGHWLTDVIGGIIIAYMGILLAHKLIPGNATDQC